MDRHEPQVQTNPNNTDTEVSADNRILNGTGNFLTKHRNRVIALLAGGALTIGLAGCGANANAEDPKPTTTHSAEANPSPTTTPKPSQSPEATQPVKKPEISREKLAKLSGYEKLSGDEFNVLPKTEQREYWKWKSEPLPEFAAGWYDFTKKPQDKYPAIVSEQNTAQEISTIQGYQLRFILSLDPSQRENALIATLENGKSSPGYQYWMDQFAKMPVHSSNPRAYAINNVLPVGTGYFIDNGESTSPDGKSKKTIRYDSSDTTTNYYLDRTEDPATGLIEPEWYAQ
jgi:hypothetical protein